MANNIAVSITADVTDLTAKMAVAQASAKEYGKAMRDVAKDVAAGDTSTQTKTNLLQVADSYSKATAEVASYARQMKSAQQDGRGNVVSAEQQKFAIRDLSYQMQDLGVGFSMAAQSSEPFKMVMMTITQQAPQVIQGIQMMRGEAGGFLGFMGGPWGAGIMAAASILGSLAAAHFSAGKAADGQKDAEDDLAKAMELLHQKSVQATASIEDGIRASLVDASAKRAQATETLKAAEAEVALARAKAASAGASVSIGAPSYSNMYNTGEESKQNALADQAQARIDKLRGQINQGAETIRGFQAEIARIHIDQQFDAGAAASARYSQRVSDLAKSYREGKITLDEYSRSVRAARVEQERAEEAAKKHGGGRTKDDSKQRAREAERERNKAAREAEQALREELQEKAAVTRQQETLAEDQARTEIDLSRIALQSKLADIDAEERGGLLSKMRAIQQRADLNNQILQLDANLEQRLYAAKLKQLQADRANYSKETKEFRDYNRQIEQLEQQHLNRIAVMKAQADSKRRQQDRLLQTESNRRMQGMAGTWSQNLARMATMQQGFTATVKGLWQGIVDVAASVIQQALEQWITAELIKIGLMKTTGMTTVASEAAKAGAGGTASMAAAPFPLNMTAPAFGASMYGAAMAYAGAGLAGFAKGTNELPTDMVAQIHAGERIVPKADNEQLLRLTARGAAMADMPFAPPAGRRASAGSAGGGGGQSITIQAMDARSFERFAKKNKKGVARALNAYVRGNGRS